MSIIALFRTADQALQLPDRKGTAPALTDEEVRIVQCALPRFCKSIHNYYGNNMKLPWIFARKNLYHRFVSSYNDGGFRLDTVVHALGQHTLFQGNVKGKTLLQAAFMRQILEQRNALGARASERIEKITYTLAVKLAVSTGDLDFLQILLGHAKQQKEDFTLHDISFCFLSAVNDCAHNVGQFLLQEFVQKAILDNGDSELRKLLVNSRFAKEVGDLFLTQENLEIASRRGSLEVVQLWFSFKTFSGDERKQAVQAALDTAIPADNRHLLTFLLYNGAKFEAKHVSNLSKEVLDHLKTLQPFKTQLTTDRSLSNAVDWRRGRLAGQELGDKCRKIECSQSVMPLRPPLPDPYMNHSLGFAPAVRSVKNTRANSSTSFLSGFFTLFENLHINFDHGSGGGWGGDFGGDSGGGYDF